MDADQNAGLTDLLRYAAERIDREDLPQTSEDTSVFSDGARWATARLREIAGEVGHPADGWNDERLTALVNACRDAVPQEALGNGEATGPRPGDRVEITAIQSYDITWDEATDIVVGLTGVLVTIDARGVAENARTGRLDDAPYEVRIDRDSAFKAGEIVFVSGVQRATEGSTDTGKSGPVVAYRSRTGTGGPRCRTHVPDYPEASLDWMPLWSDDLPDGGICTICGTDVLIDPRSAQS